MAEQPKAEAVCGACSTPGSGRFCVSCGAPLQSSEPARSSGPSSLPWLVAGIALITIAAYFAGSAYGTRSTSDSAASQNSLRGFGTPGSASGTPVRGPDISQLTPQESADRLYNRVILLAGQGKTDSVLFFAPMAISAYQMMSPLNADQRYDIGHIAELAGVLPMAKAQADTILASDPAHLLGLILGARVSSLEENETARRAFDARLLSAHDSEMAKRLPEYERHADEIAKAVSEARRPAGGTT